ncbi:hypothetical protein TNIN_281981 [Trichonephila inaurata madagascariensis]|uniref:Uncharacterized protein n=1 Tax=Trichonephila inaurata madagascariensis TaxID=2747483 RepID=A0A8X7CPG4_9ARAC|nr:hypothetical protein TNIN_281981 [Trichonephila inaurata madagascariensis]
MFYSAQTEEDLLDPRRSSLNGSLYIRDNVVADRLAKESRENEMAPGTSLIYQAVFKPQRQHVHFTPGVVSPIKKPNSMDVRIFLLNHVSTSPELFQRYYLMNMQSL